MKRIESERRAHPVKARSTGHGTYCRCVVRTVLEVAGVKNALSKSLGSTNKTNTAYATIAALDSLVPANSGSLLKHALQQTLPSKQTSS